MTSDFGSSRFLRFTRWKGTVSFESCMTYRSSRIYTRNHSSVTAIKHETKCIWVSSSLLCKVCQKYRGRKVNLAAHTCVGLVPTCRMLELYSSSRVCGVVPRYRDNFTVRRDSRIIILQFTQKCAERSFIIILDMSPRKMEEPSVMWFSNSFHLRTLHGRHVCIIQGEE
jgi:hypothetical protein